MRSPGNRSYDSLDSRLLIVCDATEVATVESALDKHAPLNWRFADFIKVLPTERQTYMSSRHLRALLRKEVHAGILHRIALYGRASQVRPFTLGTQDVDDQFIRFDKNTINSVSGGIYQQLHLIGQDWRSRITRQLGRWHFGAITLASINAWIEQFDAVESDSSRWIGEGLLHAFEFWSEDDLVDVLKGVDPARLANALCCVLAYEPGKSSDYLAVQLRKRNVKRAIGAGDDRKIEELLDLVTQQRTGDREMIVFEDGLFSGTEYVDILYSLADKVPEGRNRKFDPPSPETLQSLRVAIYFCLMTDLGLAQLDSALRRLNLAERISVLPGPARVRVVLSADGLHAKESGSLFKSIDDGVEVVGDPDRYLVYQAFEDSRIWGRKDRRQRAVETCKRLGQELWRYRLSQAGKTWPDARVEDVQLGASNLAFALAFTHSVPKASLPLFWCEGQVRTPKGRPFNWRPLFPNAE